MIRRYRQRGKAQSRAQVGYSVRALACCGAIFLMAPIVVLVVASFNDAAFLDFSSYSFGIEQYRRFMASPAWREAAVNSLLVSGMTSAASTVLGVLAALGLTRGQFIGRNFIRLFFFSPMIIPPIVLALAYYLAMSHLGLIGTRMALFLAYLPLTLPFSLLPIMASLSKLDPNLERAARSCGASPLTTFFRITLPLIRPGVFTGALFSFMVALDEVVIAVFLCGSTAVTLPKKMWSSIRFEIEPMLPAISTVLILVALCCMSLVALVGKRR
ncbi:ABC transporter permease [Desulfovibrio inopinatus]|uniref:ABC transporter permease n=1 Tax=Desulfovibrio inopinatus TaxID=102109 RepID=UPI00042A4F91|nr:ABC transporter permease [Desulfovibrio inopinatus]